MFSSDNPLPTFLAFLAEDTKVGERTARQYLAHRQRFAAWLEQRNQRDRLARTWRQECLQRLPTLAHGMAVKPATMTLRLR